MRAIVLIAAIAVMAFGLAVGCGPTMVEASQQKLQAQAGQELACTAGPPKIVYYGLRTPDIQGDSPCFGPTADKLAVVECGTEQRAYRGTGDRWEAMAGQVTAVAADHVEIAIGQGGSSLEAVARCGH